MTATLTTKDQAAAYEPLVGAGDHPTWLAERRARAWEAFQAANWPGRGEEEWMRTDARLFKLNQFTPSLEVATEPPAAAALLAAGVDLGGSFTSVNGVAVHSQFDESIARQGVFFGSLRDAIADRPDVMRRVFEREVVDPAYDRFAMLTAACWTGGTVLYVPKGVRVEAPMHAFSVLRGAGASDLTKTLVVLEERAEATLLSEARSENEEDAGLHCGSIELIVGGGAKLRYVNLQNWNHRVWHFAHQKAVVEKAGQLQWTIGALGARMAKVNQHVALTGQDAEAQVNGAMFTQGRQRLTYNTLQHHRAAYCRSDLLYKTALQDDSRTVWRGMIKVDKAAQRTDAYQRNDNLMLAHTARADSIPGLEIEADDVRCTHGSTSGRVDEEQVYYAMTRGYSRGEAVRLIVTGFFQQVFDRITIESVRNALGEAIGRRVQNLSSQ